MKSTDKVLTVYEAARKSGLPEEAVERFVKEGKIKGYQMQWSRRSWFWLLSKSSFKRFLKTKHAARLKP